MRKTSLRIQAYGGVDELNSFLGFAAESLRDTTALGLLRSRIARIQNELFDLGAQLAVLPQDRRPDTPVLRAEDVRRLEQEIDEMSSELEPLRSFVLPGGGESAARLHLARTVCRRVERGALSLAEADELDGVEIPYLNRLSDWLFVAARYATVKLSFAEFLWRPGERG